MKEEEIRPQAIFDEYLSLTQKDTISYFENVKKEDCLCPACDAEGEKSFTKQGFDYCLCDNCKTLYVSPRPVPEAFDKYYTESPSSIYWATTFYKNTADARREKLWKPKAKAVLSIFKTYNCAEHAIIDVGGGYGLFAEEIRKIVKTPVIVIEPAPHLAEVCREKGLSVIEKFLENIQETDLPNSPRAFVSFELFEHLHSPKLFLKHLWNLMKKGDIFIFTTLSGAGLDIQVLWENSKSVSPPHHLNFFNPQSATYLLSSIGFDEVSVSTPGKLDMDILLNNRSLINDRFWQSVLALSNESQMIQWQEFISKSGNSSHMMVICKKP